jgi:hypothetical protein
MTLTVEALDRAFDTADGIDGTTESSAELLRRVGIEADVFEFMYRTVAGPEKNEGRMATYLLGVVTALLATERVPADYIQRMPAPGDKWRGLGDAELQYVIAALAVTIVGSGKDQAGITKVRESLVGLDEAYIDQLMTLWRDADAEGARRRGHADEDSAP